jgi:hypothetical protein
MAKVIRKKFSAWITAKKGLITGAIVSAAAIIEAVLPHVLTLPVVSEAPAGSVTALLSMLAVAFLNWRKHRDQ